MSVMTVGPWLSVGSYCMLTYHQYVMTKK